MLLPLLPRTNSLLAELIAGRFPDERGRFGPFGGRYVPETLDPGARAPASAACASTCTRADFQAELAASSQLGGRPTALTFADGSRRAGVREVWLKREDLAHTGAHKINNAIGQALLARRLGAKRIVAETGAGQHGVASAAACARLGLPCVVYMGAVDMERQAPNVGACGCSAPTVVPVTSGDRTLRAAIDEALRDWVADPTQYLLPARLGRRPASLSLPGARAAGGDRARGARADPRRDRAPAGCASSPASAAAPTPIGTVPRLPARSRGGDHRRRGRRARAGLGENAATLAYGAPGRAARHLLDAAAGRGRTDPGDALGLRGPGLLRASAPSTRCCLDAGGCATRRRATRRHSRRVRDAERVPRASCRRSRVRMRSPAPSAGPRSHPGRTVAGRPFRARRQGHADAAARRCSPAEPPHERTAPAERISEQHPQRARAGGEPALVAYLTAGFPARARFRAQHLRALAAAADVVEIGVPFTDPMADGVTIQRASQAALRRA